MESCIINKDQTWNKNGFVKEKETIKVNMQGTNMIYKGGRGESISPKRKDDEIP